MDYLEEMNIFLEMYSLPRLNQEEIENMKRPITSNEIESVIKKLPTNKSPEPDGFTGEFYQTYKEEIITSLLKLFQKIAEERTLLHSFYEVSITLILKPDKDITHKKLQANIADEHRCKNPQQNTSKLNSKHIKRIRQHNKVGFITGCKDVSIPANQSM